MDKILSRQQLQVIKENAPKGSDGGKIIQALVDKGYKIEGLNDTPTAPVKKGVDLLAPAKEALRGLATTYGGGEQGIANKLKTDVTEGAKSIQEGDVLGSTKAGFRVAGDVAETVYAPIGAALGATGINKVFDFIGKVSQMGGKYNPINAITDIKAVQDFVAENPHLEEDFGRAMALTMAKFDSGKIDPTTVIPRTIEQLKTGVDSIKTGVNTVKDKVSNAIETKAQNKLVMDNANNLQKTVDMTGEILDKEGRIKAIKEGKGNSPTTFEKGSIQASEKDIQRANLVKDVVNSKDLNTNISHANSEIVNVSENTVKPFLAENPNIYDPKDLVNYLDRKVKPSMSIKNNPGALKMFNQIKAKALSIALKNPSDLGGILESRKILDSFIKKEFGDTVFQEAQSTAVKQAPVQVRNAFNEFITDSLKYEGNIDAINKVENLLTEAQNRGIKLDNIELAREELQKHFGVETLPENELKAGFFKYNMKRLHALYESVDNMATRAETQLNDSKVSAKLKEIKANNPLKVKAGKAAVRTTMIGGLIN